jgi:hypothetical protein
MKLLRAGLGFLWEKIKIKRRLSYFQCRNYLCNDSSLGFSKFFPLTSGKPFQVLWLVLVLNHLGIWSTILNKLTFFLLKAMKSFKNQRSYNLVHIVVIVSSYACSYFYLNILDILQLGFWV